ncbi:uncharacterized protein BKA55DRAFT_697357 [Fusarium redolens]|uniref:SnoaL-like domain-containing protein n=1 Tax=Fusarium redolens TaxID=48865 RepID=A0A9P9G0K0_FUSRE|nr:uncharacterized protein BKA55DRAFT_697357 [Fusarium redolens]KAH7222583.1 hypothetical protein BKA55DRAFT_697357 [Fusarium redolens]
MTSPTTCDALKQIARDFLRSLNDPKQVNLGFEKARNLATDDVSVTHDSYPSTNGIGAFLSGWAKAKQFMPKFDMEIIDMVAEVDAGGAGGRVWVFSKISGGKGGEERDSVDMMCIDATGKISKSKDVQRVTVTGEV